MIKERAAASDGRITPECARRDDWRLLARRATSVRRRLLLKEYWFTVLVLVGAMVAVAGPIGTHAGWIEYAGAKPLNPLDVLPLSIVLIFIVGSANAARRYWHLARTAKAHHASALAHALSALPVPARTIPPEMRDLLMALLPRMSMSDEGTLDRRHIKALTTILDWPAHPIELRLAALSALRSDPNEDVCRVVASIANQPASTRNDRLLRRRARKHLPEIRARLKERQAAGTLLRPAEPPPESTLLRPVEGGPMGDEALLLRPVCTGDVRIEERWP